MENIVIGITIGLLISLGFNTLLKKKLANNEKTKKINLIKSLEKIYESNGDNFYHGVEATSKSIDLYNKLERDIVDAIRTAPFIGAEAEIFEIELLRDWKRIEEKLLEIIARLKKEHESNIR